MPSNTKFWDELVVQSYKTILKRRPKNALVHKNLGLAYVRMNKDKKAIRSFQRAIKNEKTLAEAHYHLGTIYQRMGKKLEALKCFVNYNRLMGQKEQSAPVINELIKELEGDIK